MPNDENGDRRGRFPGFDLGGGGRGGNNRGGGGSGAPARNPWRFSLMYIIGAILVVLLVQSVLFHPHPNAASYTTFIQQVNNEEVEKATVSSSSVTWTTKDGRQFTTTLPSNYQSQDLLNLLAGKRITVNGTGPSLWTNILFNVLVWVVPFGLLYFFLFRR